MPTFNRITGGFERKKLIVIGARPSEGKSAFAMFLAYEFALKFKVLYLSLEMTLEESMFRLFCLHNKVNNASMYRGQIDQDQVNDFLLSLDRESRKLIVQQELGRDWDEIGRVMERLTHDRPDIIFVDYIQCIKTAGKKMDAIEDYIKKFRALAIERNFCVFMMSQINRVNISESKEREPTMEGLKGTGFLEEHADKVLLLHYPCKHSVNKADINDFKIIVAKNKNGLTGFVKCRIEPQHYYFCEPITDQEKTATLERVDWNE